MTNQNILPLFDFHIKETGTKNVGICFAKTKLFIENKNIFYQTNILKKNYFLDCIFLFLEALGLPGEGVVSNSDGGGA